MLVIPVANPQANPLYTLYHLSSNPHFSYPWTHPLSHLFTHSKLPSKSSLILSSNPSSNPDPLTLYLTRYQDAIRRHEGVPVTGEFIETGEFDAEDEDEDEEQEEEEEEQEEDEDEEEEEEEEQDEEEGGEEEEEGWVYCDRLRHRRAIERYDIQ